MAHTPGPWKVIRTVRGYVSHITAPKENPNHPGGIVDILRKESFIFPSSDEAAANAHLIAAAPSLLAACEALDKSWSVPFPEGPDWKDPEGNLSIVSEHIKIWKQIRAAIKEAKPPHERETV